MLDAMRRSARSLGMKFVLMMIVLTFVFMGAGSFLSRSPDEIATVNGEPVTVEEFQRTYADIMDNVRRQFGGAIDDEFLRMLNIERQALNSLIDKKLLLQVADEKSLTVTDDALIDAVARTPAFQTGGRFDREKYNMVLQQHRLSPRQFETLQKEMMLAGQIQNFVTNAVNVSETEARAWFEWENKSIDVAYAAFSPDDFQDIEISGDEILAYYEENKGKYEIPPRRQVRFVGFYPENFVSEANVSDEEIAAYYQRNQDAYKTEETATASHILIRVPESPDSRTIEEKRQKAVELYERAVEGEDFAELARTYSDCPSRQEGGHLGTFSRQDMVAPFSEKVFSLLPGEIGEPVRTRFGWHVIRLEDYQAESIIPIEDVEDEIRKVVARQKAGNIAYSRAMEMYDISFDGDDLVENAQRFGYDVKTTGFFTRARGPENIRNPQSFADKAFDLAIGQISDILEINEKYYILQPIDIKGAEVPPLEAVESDVKNDLKKEKRIKAAKQAADAFLENALKAGSFTGAAQEADQATASTGFFTRNDPVPGIGRANEFTRAAFSIREPGGIHESPLHIDGRFFVISIADQKIPEEDAFTDQKTQVKARLANIKRQETFDKWLAVLRENSEIKISDRFSRQFMN